MSVARSDVADCARAWLGTPYRHQASVRGAGADCLGLVRGVWREVQGGEPAAVPAYAPDWSEPQRDERLWRAAARYLHTVPEAAPLAVGQVLLFRMRDGSVAKHLGLVASVGAGPSFIHAYAGHGVVENRLSAPWLRRVVARFAFPERGL